MSRSEWIAMVLSILESSFLNPKEIFRSFNIHARPPPFNVTRSHDSQNGCRIISADGSMKASAERLNILPLSLDPGAVFSVVL